MTGTETSPYPTPPTDPTLRAIWGYVIASHAARMAPVWRVPPNSLFDDPPPAPRAATTSAQVRAAARVSLERDRWLAELDFRHPYRASVYFPRPWWWPPLVTVPDPIAEAFAQRVRLAEDARTAIMDRRQKGGARYGMW